MEHFEKHFKLNTYVVDAAYRRFISRPVQNEPYRIDLISKVGKKCKIRPGPIQAILSFKSGAHYIRVCIYIYAVKRVQGPYTQKIVLFLYKCN